MVKRPLRESLSRLGGPARGESSLHSLPRYALCAPEKEEPDAHPSMPRVLSVPNWFRVWVVVFLYNIERSSPMSLLFRFSTLVKGIIVVSLYGLGQSSSH
uniref:Uncharacterized protein n=1 Tax=Solanum tuberosum TaxID=4113 RepID=M1A0Q4_SOLTU